MGQITLTHIDVLALIGLLPEEQLAKQRLRVTITLGLSLEQAGLSDDIDHTVNYAEIEALVLELAEVSHFNLIERFATVLTEKILLFPPIQEVTVTVSKPDILEDTENVSVTITRCK